MSSATTKPARPSLTVLVITYALWIGALTALFLSPPSAVWSPIAWALLLFVWFPLWAWMNWSTVVEDRPATYATVIVALILLTLLGASFQFDIRSIAYQLTKLGWLETDDHYLVYPFEFLLTMLVFYSIRTTWHAMRRLFARATPSRSSHPV